MPNYWDQRKATLTLIRARSLPSNGKEAFLWLILTHQALGSKTVFQNSARGTEVPVGLGWVVHKPGFVPGVPLCLPVSGLGAMVVSTTIVNPLRSEMHRWYCEPSGEALRV